MVRIARLLLPFLLLVSLWSSEAGRLIHEADSLLKKNDKASVTRAYNNYKSAYLNALLDGDTKSAKRARSGIVKSAAHLGIDASDYDDPEDDGSGSGKSESPSDLSASDLPRILDYRANKNQIYLVLSKKIDPRDVNVFSLKDKEVNKVIFDIPGVFHHPPAHIKSPYFKDVRIAQNTPDTVRVVMEKGLDFEAEVDFLIDKLVLSAFSSRGKKAHQKSNILAKQKPAISKPVIKKNPTASNRGKTIFIDAGHGGKDGGAVGYKRIREKDIVIAITKETVRELKNRGYTVKTSRDRDVFIPLRDRTKLANRHDADLFVSVHANSIPRRIDIKGIETYFLSPARSERATKVAAKENSADLKEMSHLSQETFLSFLNREKVTAANKFAIDIQKNILANLKKHYRSVTDNGVREGPFWVLVGAQMPAVLVEVGYITNPTEAKRMRTKQYQKLIAKGIADGVDSFFYYN